MMLISEVYNEDCMIGMARYPDKFFDLAIVDPPYGIGADLNAQRNNGKWGYKKRKKTNWDDNVPDVNYFNELFRVSSNQIIWGGNYYELYPTSCFIIWDKVQRIDQADCEIAWTSFRTASRIFDYARGNDSGFAPMLRNWEKSFSNIHPTQKPVALYKWLLRNYAKPGDKILDTHLGSQSSRIAAWDGGFDFWGWELDPDYFRDGCKRFDNHIRQLDLFRENVNKNLLTGGEK